METIVITASSGAFSGLAEALHHIPVRVASRPLVSFSSPADWIPLDRALKQRSRYGALALTSPRAATAVLERVRASGITWDEGDSPPVWAVGSATAEALQGSLGPVREGGLGGEADESAATGLARAMLSAGVAGPVLFPCGDRRRDELPTILRDNGIAVDEVVSYRTVLAGAEQARAAVAGATMVVVASPSVVRLLAESCPPPSRPALIAIGPTTAAAARAAGWDPIAVPTAPSTTALAISISALLTPR